MKFEEVLPKVRIGQKAYRQAWNQTPPATPGNKKPEPVLLFYITSIEVEKGKTTLIRYSPVNGSVSNYNPMQGNQQIPVGDLQAEDWNILK